MCNSKETNGQQQCGTAEYPAIAITVSHREELEAKVKLLEKQKKFLEKQAEHANEKAILFDMMIELAEREYHIDIRKNSSPK